MGREVHIFRGREGGEGGEEGGGGADHLLGARRVLDEVGGVVEGVHLVLPVGGGGQEVVLPRTPGQGGVTARGGAIQGKYLGRAGVAARGLAPMLPGREKEGSRELPTGPSRGSGQLIGDSGL